MNDLGTFLELLAPLFPQFFLVIVCGASISKVHLLSCHTTMDAYTCTTREPTQSHTNIHIQTHIYTHT